MKLFSIIAIAFMAASAMANQTIVRCQSETYIRPGFRSIQSATVTQTSPSKLTLEIYSCSNYFANWGCVDKAGELLGDYPVNALEDINFIGADAELLVNNVSPKGHAGYIATVHPKGGKTVLRLVFSPSDCTVSTP